MGRPLPAGLDAALDGARIEAALGGVARERFGAATRVRGVSAEVLRRRVVRYGIDMKGPGPGASGWNVIGKVYESREAGQAGFHALRWLWERGFSQAEPGWVSVPCTFGYVPELQVLLMEEVGGEPLKQLLKSGQANVVHLEMFAEALVKLHRFPAAFGPALTLDDHLARRCAGLAEPLASAFPDLAAPIIRILDTARRAETPEVLAQSTLIHGDYHPGQVHLEAGRLWLVDLDPLGCGDPAYDLAMVLVGLKRFETRGDTRIPALRHAFLARYFAHMELSIAARVPLNAARILLKRACKRFRWQDEAGWEEDVRLQIRRADECSAWHAELVPPRALADVVALGERCPGGA